MKSTIKVVLVISLVLSTAVFTYADGDQEEGSRCQTCLSIDAEPEFAVETEPVSESNSETPRAAAKIKKDEITFDEELLHFIKIWLNSLLG